MAHSGWDKVINAVGPFFIHGRVFGLLVVCDLVICCFVFCYSSPLGVPYRFVLPVRVTQKR